MYVILFFYIIELARLETELFGLPEIKFKYLICEQFVWVCSFILYSLYLKPIESYIKIIYLMLAAHICTELYLKLLRYKLRDLKFEISILVNHTQNELTLFFNYQFCGL